MSCLPSLSMPVVSDRTGETDDLIARPKPNQRGREESIPSSEQEWEGREAGIEIIRPANAERGSGPRGKLSALKNITALLRQLLGACMGRGGYGLIS